MAFLQPILAARRGTLLLTVALAAFCASFLVDQSAEAQTSDRRVRFTLAVESPDDDLEGELRTRRHREMANIAASRIETRLDTIGVRDHRVRVTANNNIEVAVFGRHSEQAIKSAAIPPGRMELRPVIADETPWYDLMDMLPDGIEIRAEPGSFQTDRLYLFSYDATALNRFLSRVSLGEGHVTLYPHNEGWRTLSLGEPLATERDIESVRMQRTPSAIPFVTLNLSSEAASQVQSGARTAGARQLAVLLDGELVSVVRFSSRHFSTQMTLDCPDFLRSADVRNDWAVQVAGRLAAPLPITLMELE